MRILIIFLIALFYSAILFSDANYYKELEKKAVSGDTYSQYELGRAYLNGDELKKNHTEAMKWIKLAAESGNSNAQKELASAYQYGIYGINKDLKEAVKWYEKAVADASWDMPLKGNLAEVYYESGEYAKALEIYKEMMLGYTPSINGAGILAEMYYKGKGTKVNYEEAYLYWTICKKYKIDVDKKMDFSGKLNKKQMKEIEDKAAVIMNSYENNMGRGGDE